MSIPSVINATLARSAKALVNGDFTAWSRSVMLPFTFVSKSGTKQFETWDDLRADFDDFVRLIGLYFVTDIQRQVISVDQISPTHLIVRFSTEVFSGSHQVIAPYPATTMLHFRDGAWKASAIMGALGAEHWSEHVERDAGNVVPLNFARRWPGNR